MELPVNVVIHAYEDYILILQWMVNIVHRRMYCLPQVHNRIWRHVHLPPKQQTTDQRQILALVTSQAHCLLKFRKRMAKISKSTIFDR